MADVFTSHYHGSTIEKELITGKRVQVIGLTKTVKGAGRYAPISSRELSAECLFRDYPTMLSIIVITI